MAQNNTIIADPKGDYDDWIELKNITNETVDLSGMYLSDKLDNPLKWKIPEGTQIEAMDYLIIWANEDGNAAVGLHANFKLAVSGETILLFDKNEDGNSLLDRHLLELRTRISLMATILMARPGGKFYLIQQQGRESLFFLP